MTDIKQATGTTRIEYQLSKLGLSKDQATLYFLLIKEGPMRAHKLSQKVNLSRPLVYKVLDQLIELKLVEGKFDSQGKVNIYHPSHPTELGNLIQRKKESYTDARKAYENIASNLLSSYNVLNNKPNVKFFEGQIGLEKLYKEIEHDRQSIFLLRSFLDKRIPGSETSLLKHISARVRLGIRTRAITPLFPDPVRPEIIEEDEMDLVTRRFFKKEVFSLPAEVVIFGNKVALTSYKSSIITTVVDNPDISMSFRILFELLWGMAVEPKDLINKYKSYENV